MSTDPGAKAPRKLPSTAYQMKEGETYVPYTYGESLTEFTWKAVITGILLGIVFGAANTYLGLMAGLTISTSIPVAVLTVVTFRVFSAMGHRHSILESNMSQTVGSASSSVASGVLFTIPALFIWGMNPAWGQITLLAMSGGLVGVLFMVPLRRYLIKQEHGKLPYPEGMACAEVLVAAEGGGKQAHGVFWGLGVGMLFQLITQGLKVVKATWEIGLPFKASLAAKVNAPLLGVGYILGIRIATVMVAGGLLSSVLIIPIINLWGQGLTEPVFPETENLIRDMTSGQIWDRYIRYIGAGAVATAGIITLIKSIPTMVESFKLGIGQISQRVGGAVAKIDRTDSDLSFRTVVLFLSAILLALTLVPGVLGYLDSVVARAIAALCIAVFAFFAGTSSSRSTGSYRT
ncbi:OPT family oligopeptide transporter, partial [Gemmatimonadota bacterium]